MIEEQWTKAASSLIAPPKWLYALGGCMRWGFSCSGSGNLRLAYGPTFLRRFITPIPTTLFIIRLLSSFNCFLTSIRLPAVFSARHTLLHLLSCSAELCPSDTCCVRSLLEVKAAFWGRDEQIQMQWEKGHTAVQCTISWLSLFGCSALPLLLIHLLPTAS